MEFKPHNKWQIFNDSGRRKYLTANERERLLAAADGVRPSIRALCYVLAYTGCRISEALELTPERHNSDEHTLAFRTLKRRRICFRTIPIPEFLSSMLIAQAVGTERYWPIHRSTAWRQMKRLLAAVDVEGPMACCRGFRHGYGIRAASRDVPPHMIQRWMGHALPSTTAIYLDAVGEEEREFAKRMW